MGRGALYAPRRHPQDQRHVHLAAEHVAHLGDLVHDLVHGARDEVGEVHVRHGTHPADGRTQGGADDRRFRDRRVEDPILAELLHEPLGDGEGCAGPQILAEQAAAAPYPLLLANLRKRNGEFFDGVQPTALLAVPGLRLGLIGLSAVMPNTEAFFDIASLEGS